jgi:hypothetical protein
MAKLTALTESLARLSKDQVDPFVTTTDRQITRFWLNVDATYSDDLLASAALLGSIVTDPQADGQTFTGTWVVSEMYGDEENDRSVTIVQKLTKVTAITGETGEACLAQLPTPNVTPGVREVADFGQLKTGKVELRILRYIHLKPDATTREKLLVTITDAEWNVVLNAILAGLTIESRKWEVEPKGDWTGTLTIAAKLNTWDGSSAVANGHTTQMSGRQTQTLTGDVFGHQYEVTRQYPGIPTASVEAEARTLRDDSGGTLHIEEGATFRAEDVLIQYGANGESTITVRKTQETDTLGNPSDVTASVAVALFKDADTLPRAVTLYWPNLPQATADTLTSTFRAAASFTYEGTIYPRIRVEIDRHKSGTCTVVVNGSIPSGSGGGRWLQDEDDYYEQRLEVDESEGGDTYRVTIGRKVTSVRADAYTWCNASSIVPAINGHREKVKGGWLRYNSNLGLYEAFKETWEVLASAPASPFGDIGS